MHRQRRVSRRRARDRPDPSAPTRRAQRPEQNRHLRFCSGLVRRSHVPKRRKRTLSWSHFCPFVCVLTMRIRSQVVDSLLDVRCDHPAIGLRCTTWPVRSSAPRTGAGNALPSIRGLLYDACHNKGARNATVEHARRPSAHSRERSASLACSDLGSLLTGRTRAAAVAQRRQRLGRRLGRWLARRWLGRQRLSRWWRLR